ncbi:hypothetical protein [Schlesneria sp. DSM 10557]|uniref:hypothetical protein n=1 Tax=Schlesneria sp. DSM 10557 TaxID=3044399 RepID=UPI0035A05C78
MTATVTTIQNALKSALTGVTTPVPFNVRVAEADVSDIPSTQQHADVLIGFEASARLARTEATILEQMLIPITIRRRYSKSDQAALGINHELAEILRDKLSDYHSSTARVEQLLSPHPYDEPQAVGPGIWVNRFVLDMDVLRHVSEIVTDTTTDAQLLTKIRRAVWDALNNWSEWDDETWSRKFELDADLDELALHDPGLFDLPAIAVNVGPTNPRFMAHTVQDWPVTVDVVAWFPIHAIRLAEYRAWQIQRAIYQGAPEDAPTMTYIRTASGRLPEKNPQILFEPVQIGRAQQLKAVRMTCTFTITGLVSPWSD